MKEFIEMLFYLEFKNKDIIHHIINELNFEGWALDVFDINDYSFCIEDLEMYSKKRFILKTLEISTDFPITGLNDGLSYFIFYKLFPETVYKIKRIYG